MMEERTFKSVDEIMRFYCPKKYKKDQLAKMTPEEFGKKLAQDLLDEIRKQLRDY